MTFRIPCVSILVFVELALELTGYQQIPVRRIVFQSLFLWNWRSNFGASRTYEIITALFQSLFLWNWRSNLTEYFGPGSFSSSVSILVFVELALEPWGRMGMRRSAFCFNPCFCGTGARTPPTSIAVSQSSTGFNPCFCGTGARTTGTGPIARSSIGFNPCFCGTGARTGSWRLRGETLESFNPCFCGTGARTVRSCGMSPYWNVQFQSLFLWNWRSNQFEVKMNPEEESCFNPCFCGTGARTSLSMHSLPSSSSFNPCFCGTGARTLSREARTKRSLSFNPCFCGTGARTLVTTMPYPCIVLFQSLFLWNWRSNCS